MRYRNRTYKNYHTTRETVSTSNLESYLQTLVNKIQEVNLKVEKYEEHNKSLLEKNIALETNINNINKLNTELELKIINISHILSDTLHKMYNHMNTLNSKHDDNLKNLIHVMNNNSKEIITTTITELLNNKS